jgi:hypothetical protein
MCSNTSSVFSVPQVAGASSYSWSLPAGWSGSSNTNSISVTSGMSPGSITVTAINACGTSSAVQHFVDLTDCVTTSIINFNAEERAIRVFPNPSSGSFVIEGINIQGLEVKIYDVTGRLVHSQKTDLSRMEVDVHVAQGLYQAKIFHEGKILKQVKVSIQ